MRFVTLDGNLSQYFRVVVFVFCINILRLLFACLVNVKHGLIYHSAPKKHCH